MYKCKGTGNDAEAVYSSVRGSQNTERHLANKGGNKQLAQPPPLNQSTRALAQPPQTPRIPQTPQNMTVSLLSNIFTYISNGLFFFTLITPRNRIDRGLTIK